MTAIPLPSSVRIRHVEWSLDRPAQVNRSPYTAKRTVVAEPWHGLWRGKVELAPIIGETNFRPWRAFLAKLQGQINTFQLPATEGPQNSNVGVTVSSTAAQGAKTMSISGAATPLLAGQYFTVNHQLCCCTADQSGAVLSFEPPLRQQATAGTVVVTSRPYALVALDDSAFAWSVDPGTLYGLQFGVEEVILEPGGSVPESTGAGFFFFL